VRGMRLTAYHFGCTVFTQRGTLHGLAGEEPPAHLLLARQIVQFLQTGRTPIDPDETVEVMAFLDAAGRSLESGGEPMELAG